MPIPRADLALVASALGTDLVGSREPEWGDRAATIRADLADGRAVAVRRLDGPGAGATARRIAGIAAHLEAAGLPVSTPSLIESEGAIWLVAPWIDGETGAAWLGDPDRARHLARRMGRLAQDLCGVDAGGLGLDPDETSSDAVVERARASMAIARDLLDAPARAAIGDALEGLDTGPAGPRALVHGDFAPVNVILDAAGEIVALLDLEHARIGPSLLDVAWWGWVVRHHHPDAWSVAWTTFLTAAGVEPGLTIDREIRSLQVIRLLEAVVAAEDATTRAIWLGRLSEAVAW